MKNFSLPRNQRIVFQHPTDLFLQLGAKDGGGLLAEAVDPTGDAALVRQVPRDPALVLGPGPPDE